ncbi:aminodeoxychorismate synthase component I [bacterium]|nr:MAG: aminodeoxychorismate synthase component I [bacterium]
MDYGQLILDFEGRSISGSEPFTQLESRGDSSFWEELKSLLREGARLYPQGGAIGFVGYEAVQSLEPRAYSRQQPDDLNLPVARLVFYKDLEKVVQTDEFKGPIELSEFPDQIMARDFYQAGVRKTKEYIAAGDIYQANLTHRVEMTTSRSAMEIYGRLQHLGRAPRAALLEWEDFAVVSNSPETFLTLREGVLEAKPIKGTIARGTTAEADLARKAELARSVKDKAENVMIVDLMRNDLGRVCEYGSVQVPSLYQIETFPTLHHGVSTVRGHLRPECDALDAFLAAFPCGSITGAPKMRAMQILSEIEPVPRGVSMGAIGYFAFNGDMEWSVSIRTATVIKNRAYFHVGGGIVADSQPDLEYEEMRLKARALYSAIGD